MGVKTHKVFKEFIFFDNIIHNIDLILVTDFTHLLLLFIWFIGFPNNSNLETETT